VKVQDKVPVDYPVIVQKPAPAGSPGAGKTGQAAGSTASFGEILSAEFERAGGIKLSAHAERRLQERNLTLNREDLSKIEGAVQKAAAKGSRESLVIFGDLALVASVRNRTIITAMQGKDMQDHVFTNIDSAVIVK